MHQTGFDCFLAVHGNKKPLYIFYAIPSIEAAKKIAQALEVSLDYLAGEGINAHFDKKTVQRLQDIEDLSPAVKEKLFFLIDTILRDTKAQKAYAH